MLINLLSTRGNSPNWEKSLVPISSASTLGPHNLHISLSYKSRDAMLLEPLAVKSRLHILASLGFVVTFFLTWRPDQPFCKGWIFTSALIKMEYLAQGGVGFFTLIFTFWGGSAQIQQTGWQHQQASLVNWESYIQKPQQWFSFTWKNSSYNFGGNCILSLPLKAKLAWLAPQFTEIPLNSWVSHWCFD